MAKQKIAFRKSVAFDEYILALKCFMEKHKIEHVTGFCDAGLLNRTLTEGELAALYQNAVRHQIFVCQKDELHFHHDILNFLTLAADSKYVLTLHKPSYAGHKLITFFYVGGMFGATVQDELKNNVLLLADKDLDLLYTQVSGEIRARDTNKGFNLKKLRRTSGDKGIANVFAVKHEFQLIAFPAENSTGKQAAEALMFNVGKQEYELLTGDLENGSLETCPIATFDQRLTEYIRKICQTENSENRIRRDRSLNRTPEDTEPYTKYSFQKLASSQDFPKNPGQLLKTIVKGVVQNLRSFRFNSRVVFRIVFCLLIAGFAVFWNMYGMCYLNDTFWLDRKAFLGNVTPYLFAGTAGSRDGFKGLSVLKNLKDTSMLAAPVYFFASILIMSALNTLISGKVKAFFQNIVRFPARCKLYFSRLDRPFSYYFWTSVFGASLVGLLLFNPFAVVLLAVILLLSALKGDDSSLGAAIMICRSALSYKKVLAGKKEPPLFAGIVMRIWSFGLALLTYSAVNFVIWHAFAFNYWSRVIFTVLLMVLSLFRIGILKFGKLEKGQKITIFIAFILAGAALLAAAGGAVVALADDGGWSESGRTLAGLFNNSGFPTIMAFSLILGAAAFFGAVAFLGATALTAGAVAAVTGAAALTWSATTETGRETAFDFVQGKYSPYGGDSLIAAGLNMAVGFVPFVGSAWGTVSGARDATYDFSNGNYLEGIIETAFAGLSAYRFGTEVSAVINRYPSSIANDIETRSSYEERINRTPKNNGTWTGERGESTFISDKVDDVGKYLDDAGIDGITYYNGQPDFSPVSKGNVSIGDMSVNRLGADGNFSQADELLASLRGDCTARDVANWRRLNGYTWHECNDLTTMQKIPSVINKTYTHLGGVSECGHDPVLIREIYKRIYDLFD